MAHRPSVVRSTFRSLVTLTLRHAMDSLYPDFTQTKPGWLMHLHPPCTPRAHQRFLWCIRGSNRTWCSFVCRHGSCLLTKTGSKQHGQCPKWTKISYISSVQHADPGIPISPFQGLSEYTPNNPPPPPPPTGQGNNDDDHRKPTELA